MTIYKKLKRKAKFYIIRLNQYLPFNSLRMFIYKNLIQLKVGKQTMIWCGNKFPDVPQDFEVGKNSIIGPNNVFLVGGGIEIGSNVNLSGFSYFISQGHHANDPEYKTTFRKIVIEDDVWVATNCTIGPGVTLGKGCVVAAGSVVTKSVPAFTIVGGNPAKHIKNRNTELSYKLNSMHGTKWF